MHSKRHSLKRALFDKGEDEPLTPDEQAELDEITAWIQPANIIIDPDEPAFREALKIYSYIQKEHTTTWEQVKQVIMQHTEPASNTKPLKKRIWLWTKWTALAASILLIVGGYLWSHKSNQPIQVMAQITTGNIRVITLPDGTLVLLNKDSKITYPETFAANERRVGLSGEAFFVVKHDATKSFLVSVGNTTITDLGTKFNVRSYANESSVTITVQEGKVKIKGLAGEKEIDSGLQAIATAGSLNVMQPTNIDSITTWKNQYIYLDDRSTQSVMEQIHTFYEIEYTLQDTLPSLGLKGQISIENPIDSTIKFLNDAARTTSFRMQGRKVVVSQKARKR